MADDKQKGPVKPPIIDAKPTAKTANEKPSVAPSAKPAAAKPSTTKRSAPSGVPKPQAPSTTAKSTKPDQPQSGRAFTPPIVASLIGVTLLGAALGTGATSFMAFNGIAPFEKGVPSVRFSTSMEALQKRVYDLENAPKSDLSSFVTQEQLDTLSTSEAVNTLNAQLNILADRINTIESELPATSASDLPIDNPFVDPALLTQLQSEIAGVKASILELSPDNTQALEAQFEQNQKLEATIAKVTTLALNQNLNVASLNDLKIQIAKLSQALTALTTKVDAQPAPVTLPASTNLPLILNAWGDAISSGAPFDNYLTTAQTILPDLQSTDAQSMAASTGVTTSAALHSEFVELIPALISSDANLPADAAWYDKLVAQAKSAIGLRPLDQSGNDPLAIVARVEIALEQGDLTAASGAFEQLPADLLVTASEFGDRLNSTTQASALLDQAKKLTLQLATADQGATQ